VAGFVVCASCGTQIKAGRAYCLRCGEELPVEGAPVKVSVLESLELSQRKVLVLLTGVAVVVFTLVVVIWKTQPRSVDEAAPFNQAGNRSLPVAPAPVEETTAAAELPPSVDPAPAPGPPGEVRVTTFEAIRRGAAAYKSGNFDAARAAYELALAQNPDDAEVLNNLGLTLMRLNKVSEAIPRFERAVVLAPNKASFHFNFAQAAGLLGQWDRAIAEYRASVRLSPDEYAARYNLASALQKKGDDQAAILEFQRAIELAPEEASFHLSLGRSLEQVGRVAEATREYEIYLERAPSTPEAEVLRAHLKTLAEARKRPPAS
jgi:Flp pilus assembly protein TadD